MKRRNYRFNILLSLDEKEMIRKLKQQHSINVSNYFRNTVKELYNKMSEKKL